MLLRHAVTILAAVLTAAAPAVAAEKDQSRERERDPSVRPESERETKIRKAREEIRKNPAQKKFILFRYGLDENDL